MERDPSGQLAWLAAELEAAEAAGERVWLIGHMPLGTSDSFHDQSEYFDQIVQRFDATISALFFGHTHQDEFQISYSTPASPSADTAVMVSYIAPALTPTSGNPTFRVYSVDPVTFGILDYTVYYANISSQSYQSGPTWEVLYSVKEAYGSLVNPPVTDASAELTPAFWHDLTVLFEENDDVYQTWYARRGRDYSEATCTGTCKTTSICQLRAAQSQYNWYVSATCRPLFFLKHKLLICTYSAQLYRRASILSEIPQIQLQFLRAIVKALLPFLSSARLLSRARWLQQWRNPF